MPAILASRTGDSGSDGERQRRIEASHVRKRIGAGKAVE